MMRDRRRLLLRALLPALILLSACARRASPPDVVPEERAAPTWIRVRPDETDLFIGIGYTPQTNNPLLDQQNAARQAREDLLVAVQSGLKRAVGSGEVAETLWPRVAWADLAGTLDELPPQDVYLEEHKRRVWALVKLDRAAFEKSLASRTKTFEGRARKRIADALSAERKGQLVQALRDQLAALYYVAGPEGFYMRGGEGHTYLRQEIEASLRKLIDQVEVRRISGPEHSRATGLEGVHLVVQTLRRADGTPLPAVPLAFRFARGAGSVTPTGTTDAQGRLNAALTSLDPRVTPVEIDATLDLQALLASSRLPPLPEEVLAHIALPKAAFLITLEAPRLLLSHVERGGTGGGRGALLVNELSEAFRKQGLAVQDASVKMLVNPEVFDKVEHGKDPGAVEGTDLIGVVVISLNRVRREKGRYQDILYGEGEALFRLYDLERHTLVMDVRLPQQVSGFSQGDIERNFFLQGLDELRARVLDALADDSFLGRGKAGN